jgi:quinol monooxygenase YgiN
MITRIVKMTFRNEEIQNFLMVFNANKQFIAGSEGCRSLELLNVAGSPGIFFTISEWDSEEHLNAYRNSELFERVWGKTKQLFADKPEAWTLVGS